MLDYREENLLYIYNHKLTSPLERHALDYACYAKREGRFLANQRGLFGVPYDPAVYALSPETPQLSTWRLLFLPTPCVQQRSGRGEGGVCFAWKYA